jgi:hypothetical protein
LFPAGKGRMMVKSKRPEQIAIQNLWKSHGKEEFRSLVSFDYFFFAKPVK